MTTEILSRLQFAFTISFHILFPAFTIGLAGFLALFEGLWLKTNNIVYLNLYKFWSKIFALGFAMGVVSGLVLSFELGTNFGEFTRATGNVLGPLLAYEVLSAFFLEAGFLGIMLFGLQKVGRKLHFLATIAVMVGTSLSAFWIVSANSWMQSPSGFRLEGGVFFVQNWKDVIFNPTFPYRLTHVLIASYLTAAFIILGISAYYLLRQKYIAFARQGFKWAALVAFILTPLQIIVGDLHGLKTEQMQPMKVAAMEGRWDTMAGAPLILFAIPNMATESNSFEFSIPKGASLILTHSLDGVVKGLKEVPAEERPNVPLVFFSFRVMILCGFMMLGIACFSGYIVIKNLLRKRNFVHPLLKRTWFLKVCIACTPIGFLATLAGWYVTEIGRQPWVVYGLLKIKDALSIIPPQAVMISLILFVMVYNVLLLSFLFYTLKLIRKGPEDLHMDMPVTSPEIIRTPHGA